jgi:hypothetical protein
MRVPAPTVRLSQDLGEACALAVLLTCKTMAEMMIFISAKPDWTFNRRW